MADSVIYSRPLIHHQRRNYRGRYPLAQPLPLRFRRNQRYYVLPEDTRSRPRHNPQETINMVKSSLLKTPEGRALLQQGRDSWKLRHSPGPDYNPTRREYERGENQILFEEGYLNKRLLDWKGRGGDETDTATDPTLKRLTPTGAGDPEREQPEGDFVPPYPEWGENLQDDLEWWEESLRLHQDKLKKYHEDLYDYKDSLEPYQAPEFVNDAELRDGYGDYQRRIPPTYDARRRYRLTKAQRNLPREAWGTDMDIPEENWNKKMRKARLEAGIGTQQFPTLRVEDIK